jgi:hypothetical protein
MLRTAGRIIAYPRKTHCDADGIHAQRSTAASRSSPEAAPRCAEGAELDGGGGRRTITCAVHCTDACLRYFTNLYQLDGHDPNCMPGASS